MGQQDDDLIKEFLQETADILDKLDQDLVTLERNRSDKELLNAIFRAFHTTKGTAGFLGFARLQKVTHAAEGVLDRMRSGKMAAEGPVMDEVLASVDAIRRIVDGIRASGAETALDFDPLISRLKAHAAGSAPPGPEAKEWRPLGEILIEQGVKPEAVKEALSAQEAPPKVGEILVERMAATPEQVQAALEKQKGGGPVETEQEIRVGVGRLDKLMNLAGELVLCRNRLAQINRILQQDRPGKESDLMALNEALGSLDLLTGDIQTAVMKTRMQPVGRVFGKFPRVVRDLARDLGKRIRLDVVGAETEMDKSIVEAVNDPLVHLIRNACDHGIEMPAVRKAAGKPEEGVITLAAYHEGNAIVIRIRDDGKGLDPGRLGLKAVEKGLISDAERRRMSPKEIQQLIFAAGFSMAEKVTNVSGRGVGMDVVRSNVERLNGTIDLVSEAGKGTTILLRMPLTLAIVQTLLVEAASEVYAIPLSSVSEAVKIPLERIHCVDQQDVLNFRDRVIPVLALARLFHAAGTPRVAEGAGECAVVILSLAEKRLGLVVDRPLGQEEVVIKSLSGLVRNTEAIAGATIRGDGRVVLILDVAGLMKLGIAGRSGVPR